MKSAHPTGEPTSIIALDIGEKRIGVARGDVSVRVPVPHVTLEVDKTIWEQLKDLITELNPALIIVGLPRNQSGATTSQTAAVRDFAAKLERFGRKIVFQDESLTSVMAENQLKTLGKPYTKADIDARAAAIILGDYLESHVRA